MAEKYSFFNAVMDEAGNYDREYLAEDFAEYFSSFVNNGVYSIPTSSLEVKAKTNMTIEVKKGKAWINGYFYENTEPKSLTLDLSDGVNSRIDRIVLRLDLINRKITTEVKKGASSSYPQPPELERGINIYELSLAEIKVNLNSISINQGDIKDTRADANVCGIVSKVVTEHDNRIDILQRETKEHEDRLEENMLWRERNFYTYQVDTSNNGWSVYGTVSINAPSRTVTVSLDIAGQYPSNNYIIPFSFADLTNPSLIGELPLPIENNIYPFLVWDEINEKVIEAKIFTNSVGARWLELPRGSRYKIRTSYIAQKGA